MPPLPKTPETRRRTNSAPFHDLPAEGRQGKPPAWPLSRKATRAEAALWRQVWATPQATQWEPLGYPRIVARYVILLIQAEVEGVQAYVLTEARHLEDRLGLSPKAMRSLGWRIRAADADAPAPASVSAIADYRAMLNK
jgi:hypothetical protein